MKTLRNTILFILIAFLINGCTATMSYLNDGIEKYSPTNKTTIKIYSERDIDKDVIELGYVAVNMTDFPKGDVMKDKLKECAAKLGADAIVNFQILANTAEGIAVKYK